MVAFPIFTDDVDAFSRQRVVMTEFFHKSGERFFVSQAQRLAEMFCQRD